METKKRDQVNTDFTKHQELMKSLQEMAEEDDMKLGPFLRKLVKQEKARRQQKNTPHLEQPNRRRTDGRAAQAVAA